MRKMLRSIDNENLIKRNNQVVYSLHNCYKLDLCPFWILQHKAE